MEMLVVPSTVDEAERLAGRLRAAMPVVVTVEDMDGSPIRLTRTRGNDLWAWMASPDRPNRWSLLGISLSMGRYGTRPVPITTGSYAEDEGNLRATALHTAVRASTAPLAAALAGAAVQARGVALQLTGRSAVSPFGYEVLNTMLCQVAAYQETDPETRRAALRLLAEGFPRSPTELLATATDAAYSNDGDTPWSLMRTTQNRST